jgi:hypothetical protein
MRSWAREALLLGTALFLVLPPGWCCVLPQLGKATASPNPAPSCCGPRAHSSKHICLPPEQEDGPTTPACCCPLDTALPPSPEALPDDLGPAPLVVVAGADGPLVGARFVLGLTSFATSPPRQLLHCVWLC